MKKIFLAKFITLAACLVIFVISGASADDSRGKKKRERSHDHRNSSYAYQVPAVYKESCGSCHMVYGAYLLPEASWRKILGAPDQHFGAELNLDMTEKQQVSDYLFTNAAERSGHKIGGKIMKHAQNSAPDRISTIPYIQRKHRKIDPAVFARPSIGGLQNCIACHPGAERGDFDDDQVQIPREAQPLSK